jgi:hypothetical protein
MEILDTSQACFTHQASPNILIESVAQAAVTLKNKLYFHFTWITNFVHDSARNTELFDGPVLQLLQDLTAESLLNNTVFILMSDHGMSYGKYMELEQGMLESRMPMMTIAFPVWFEEKYSRAVGNMRRNARRLSTPFDLHETLKDLLDVPGLLSDSELRDRREVEPYSLNRGISLFLPIPRNRTCVGAGIDDHWCICWSRTLIPNPSKHPHILNILARSVGFLNTKLSNFPMCAFLELDSIILAREIHQTKENRHRNRTRAPDADADGLRMYDIVFKVSPSGGIFQATWTVDPVRAEEELGGPLSRINAYKDQGDCIDSTRNGNLEVKAMCYCLEYGT